MMKILSYLEIIKCPLVKVQFYDHCSNSTDLIECECYGRLIYKDALKLIIVHWLPKHTDLDDLKTDWEIFTLLRSSIITLVTLREPKNRP